MRGIEIFVNVLNVLTSLLFIVVTVMDESIALVAFAFIIVFVGFTLSALVEDLYSQSNMFSIFMTIFEFLIAGYVAASGSWLAAGLTSTFFAGTLGIVVLSGETRKMKVVTTISQESTDAEEDDTYGLLHTVMDSLEKNNNPSLAKTFKKYFFEEMIRANRYSAATRMAVAGLEESQRAFILDVVSHRPKFSSPKDMPFQPTKSVELQNSPGMKLLGLPKAKGVLEWNYNAFRLETPIVTTVMNAVHDHGLLRILPVNEARLVAFLREVERLYEDNPYHNMHHAADVTHSMHYFCVTFLSKAISPLHFFSALIAAACHDVGHPGLNNAYQEKVVSPLARRYNNRSVLENHHSAVTFELLSQESFNFVEEFSGVQFYDFRKTVLEIILATDMAQHFDFVVRLKASLTTPPPLQRSNSSRDGPQPPQLPKPSSKRAMNIAASCVELGTAGFHASEHIPIMLETPDPLFLLQFAMKLVCFSHRVLLFDVSQCDLGHVSKRGDLHVKWSMLITQEFFNQGDREKELGLDVSPSMDRCEVDVYQSQFGFLKFFCLPFYEQLAAVFPCEASRSIVDSLTQNIALWQDKVPTLWTSLVAGPAVKESIIQDKDEKDVERLMKERGKR